MASAGSMSSSPDFVPSELFRDCGSRTFRPKDKESAASAGDLAFAQKCADLQQYNRPLLELLHGLKSGRFDKGLTSFQQSVAMDRLQRIVGILQKPDMGEKYLQNLLQIEVMLKIWFPRFHTEAMKRTHHWCQTQLHIPVKKRKMSWPDPERSSALKHKPQEKHAVWDAVTFHKQSCDSRTLRSAKATPTDDFRSAKTTPTDDFRSAKATPTDDFRSAKATPTDDFRSAKATPTDDFRSAKATPTDDFRSAKATPTDDFRSAKATPTDDFRSAKATPTDDFRSAKATPTDDFRSAKATPTDDFRSAKATPTDDFRSAKATPTDDFTTSSNEQTHCELPLPVTQDNCVSSTSTKCQ